MTAAIPGITPERLEVLNAGLADLSEAERRAAWLEKKRHAIGGTDVAAILGLSKWKSPMQVWLEKKGVAETSENDAMRWGKRLERPILQGYADAVGHPIEFADPYAFLVSPKLDILGASLDARWSDADRRPVDAKNTRFKGDDWGEPGTDVIPLYYAAQLAVQMHVTDTPAADLAVLFSGQQLEAFTVWRDMETEAGILEKVAVWWDRHIVRDIPPEVDGLDSTTKWIASRFRQQTEALAVPTPELAAVARELARLKAELKARETEQARLENILKQAIGDAAGITGLCTWKQAKDSDKTDWEALARVYLASLDSTSRNAVLAQYTTTKPGSRRFLLTVKEA